MAEDRYFIPLCREALAFPGVAQALAVSAGELSLQDAPVWQDFVDALPPLDNLTAVECAVVLLPFLQDASDCAGRAQVGPELDVLPPNMVRDAGWLRRPALVSKKPFAPLGLLFFLSHVTKHVRNFPSCRRLHLDAPWDPRTRPARKTQTETESL